LGWNGRAEALNLISRGLARALLRDVAVNWTRTLGLIVFIVGAAVPSYAQTDSKFAVGAEFGVRASTAPEAHGSPTPGILWRFGRSQTGWGFHWGLNWYSTDIDRSIVGQNIELGELKVRPFMAGYGYTYNYRRYSITAAILGGFALTSMTLAPGAGDVYVNRLGARAVTSDASNTLVAKPEVNVWYDINKKFGLNVTAGYMIARPSVNVRSTLGTDSSRVRADMFTIKAGLAYSVF